MKGIIWRASSTCGWTKKKNTFTKYKYSRVNDTRVFLVATSLGPAEVIVPQVPICTHPNVTTISLWQTLYGIISPHYSLWDLGTKLFNFINRTLDSFDLICDYISLFIWPAILILLTNVNFYINLIFPHIYDGWHACNYSKILLSNKVKFTFYDLETAWYINNNSQKKEWTHKNLFYLLFY